MEEKKSDYPEGINNCFNCQYFMDGRCHITKNQPEKPRESCPIGEFQPLKTKKLMQEAYNNIVSIIDYYIDIPEPIKNVVALWTIGTHFHSQFKTYPYLFANAMRGSGKTRLLKIINAFAKDSQLVNSLTESTMFRTIGTLLLDEFEGLGSKDNAHLRELLNSAYKSGTRVLRMKKSKNFKEEGYVVEHFEPYRPIAMANIWGMEEVLGDRCINVRLEKSTDLSKIKLVEDFDDLFEVEYAKKVLTILNQCRLCSVCRVKNIHKEWNTYTKNRYPTHHTLHTHNTLHTLPTLKALTKIRTESDELEEFGFTIKEDFTRLFKKIDETEVDGRNLELFFPLFIIAAEMENEAILEEVLTYAKQIVRERRTEEITESKDVMVYRTISGFDKGKWVSIKNIIESYRMVMGGGTDEEITAEWVGRALKRLNLVIDKRRVGSGIEVTLDSDKAKKKLEIFQPKTEEKRNI